MDIASLTGNWDLSTLPDNVSLGRDVWIEDRQTFLRFRSQQDPGLILGDGVRVYTWSRFSIEPPGTLEVGDHSVLVGAMIMGAGTIRIGRRVVVAYGVTIADSDFHPHDPELRRLDAVAHSPQGDLDARQPFETAPVVIEDDARIGVGAIVLKGVTIGAGARIAPGAVVTRSVPPGSTAAGNPARILDASDA